MREDTCLVERGAADDKGVVSRQARAILHGVCQYYSTTRHPTMSGTNLSGTRTRYEEHERQLKEIQAQIAKHAKPGPGPVIDFRVCHLLWHPFLHLTPHCRPTDPQAPWNSDVLQILLGASTLTQPAHPVACTSSTLSTTVVLAATLRISTFTLASSACQILSHSNPWAVSQDAVAVRTSTRFLPAICTKSVPPTNSR